MEKIQSNSRLKRNAAEEWDELVGIKSDKEGSVWRVDASREFQLTGAVKG